MKVFKSFLTDDDGLNQRDFMLITFTSIYAIAISVAYYFSLKGTLNPQTVAILDNLQLIVLTIIGAVFSVQVVNTLKSGAPQTPIATPIQPTTPSVTPSVVGTNPPIGGTSVTAPVTPPVTQPIVPTPIPPTPAPVAPPPKPDYSKMI